MVEKTKIKLSWTGCVCPLKSKDALLRQEAQGRRPEGRKNWGSGCRPEPVVSRITAKVNMAKQELASPYALEPRAALQLTEHPLYTHARVQQHPESQTAGRTAAQKV